MTTINRRRFLQTASRAALAAGAVGPALCTGWATAAGTSRSRQPNIIFIMADDLGYTDIGAYGQKMIATPNIDRLAAEGMKFTQCYAGGAVCAPSRSCLMTGQHLGHTRIRWNADGYREGRILLPEDITVAEVLKEAGYVTGAVGKWGLGEPDTTGHPNRQGFDFWFGYLDQVHAHEYYTDHLWRNEEKVVLSGNLNGKQTEYSNDLMNKEVLEFVRRVKDKPFFLYHTFTIPHAKFQVPDLGPYADKPWTETQKIFAAMMHRYDGYIGDLLALLRELGLEENTVIFFTSDNGAPSRGGDWDLFRRDYPFRAQKGSPYEGGTRVPMIVRWPGKVKAGAVSDQVWAFWDFLPTAAEIAGAKCPPNIDGISMVPALLGQPQQSHDFLYWETHQGGFAQAVRMGDWKGVRFGLKEPLELYNLKEDPAETKNVAAEQRDIVAKIERYLDSARTESAAWPAQDFRQTKKTAGKAKSKAKKEGDK
ncbi:MAG: arylsulfatase [Candidatus Sumerlaeia bacterium]|nr:arylsulfatase [Candidatus Sumerlaeia bacterium]